MEEDEYFENDFEDHEDIPEFVGSGEEVNLETPTSASENAIFWEEIKKSTRTYPDTDEVALLIRLSPRAHIMEHMFHYLCACCAFSASSDTIMSQTQLHEHYCMVAMSIVRTMPTQARYIYSFILFVFFKILYIRFLSGIFASITGNSWPEGFPGYMEEMMAENPTKVWFKANRVRLASPEKLKTIYFGSRVQKSWEDFRRFINNVLNPIWKRVPDPIL